MTVMTIDLIKARIQVAEPSSPIAVFSCGAQDHLNAVFANTVETQRWIREGVFPLVGVYHNRMNVERVCRFLSDMCSGEGRYAWD